MKINSLSETAVTLTFGDEISIASHSRVIDFYYFLKAKDYYWLRELVPAYVSLTIFVDFAYYENNSSLKPFFSDLYSEFEQTEFKIDKSQSRLIELEVDYNGEDNHEVARYCNISTDELIEIHSTPLYLVAMIGFTPGFPYLLGLDARLVVPRRATPRLSVPKGSVAIGGEQTGIYTQASPGGWQIIGSIKENLFDIEAFPPNLLISGDRVKFKPI